jgi:hypothetical protein
MFIWFAMETMEFWKYNFGMLLMKEKLDLRPKESLQGLKLS